MNGDASGLVAEHVPDRFHRSGTCETDEIVGTRGWLRRTGAAAGWVSAVIGLAGVQQTPAESMRCHAGPADVRSASSRRLGYRRVSRALHDGVYTDDGDPNELNERQPMAP